MLKRALCGLLCLLVLVAQPVVPGMGLDTAQAASVRLPTISAGHGHSFYLTKTGQLYGWGYNKYGQVGDGTTTNRSMPVLVGSGFTAIETGLTFSVGLKGDALYTWGENWRGQLGTGTKGKKTKPTLIGKGYTAISVGYGYVLALKGNDLYAWGNNMSGTLGDGTFGAGADKRTPVFIGSGFTAISAGGMLSMALKGDELYVWGAISYDPEDCYPTPMRIGSGYTAISGPFALKGDALYRWNGPMYYPANEVAPEYYPQPELIGTGFTAVSGGVNALALKGDVLYVLGISPDGYTPVEPVRIGEGYTAISVGSYHSMALKGDALYVWGSNEDYGQLGIGDSSVEYLATPTCTLNVTEIGVNKSSLNAGQKVKVTVETSKVATKVALYDQNGTQLSATKKFKAKGKKRIWTFTRKLTAQGGAGFYALASRGGMVGEPSTPVSVSVGAKSLSAQSFAIDNLTPNVGDTLTITLVTGTEPGRVSIVDADNRVFASASTPTTSSGTGKTWTIERALTEADIGSLTLRALASDQSSTDEIGEPKLLTVADAKPRAIRVLASRKTLRRNAELVFTVETNAAATGVRISNDKKEQWTQATLESELGNRKTWRVVVRPKKIGSRKFYAEGLLGALVGTRSGAVKVSVKK